MIRAFLRRWLGVGEPIPTPPGALEKRVTELEESVEYLALALRKLRGRVTGGVRGLEVDDAARDEALPNPPHRGNPLALELLAKRNRAVSR